MILNCTPLRGINQGPERHFKGRFEEVPSLLKFKGGTKPNGKTSGSIKSYGFFKNSGQKNYSRFGSSL